MESKDIRNKLIKLYLPGMIFIFLISYVFLAIYHQNPNLFNVIIHENGRLTLFETIFTFDHFLGQLPMVLLFPFFLVGAYFVSGPEFEIEILKKHESSIRKRLAGLMLVAILLMAVLICGSINLVGLKETVRILLQYKVNDTLYTYGGNWNMMVLSNFILFLIALGFTQYLRTILLRQHPKRNSVGLLLVTIGTLFFCAMLLVFRTGPEIFTNPRWLAHSVREVFTNSLITIPLVILSLIFLESRYEVKTRKIANLKEYIRAHKWAFIIIPMIAILLFAFNLMALIGINIGEVAQQPAYADSGRLSVAYLAASHFFEHSIDYLFILLLSLILYYAGMLFIIRKSRCKPDQRGAVNNYSGRQRNSDNLNWMYDEVPLPQGGEGRNEHWRRQIRKYFGDSYLKGKKILDAGCGTGTVTKILTGYSDRVYACDISPNSIELAKKFAPKARYKISNVLDLDYEDESFDVVVCIGVIHHTNDAYKAFRELVRVTKPGGRILLFVYNKLHPYYPIYNLTRPIFRNRKIEDIPSPFIKAFGFFVSLFYKEEISFEDAQHWFSDILLTPIAHHYSYGTIKRWSEENACVVKKVGYTLLRMNLLTLIEKKGETR